MATKPGAVSALITEAALYESLGSQKQQSANPNPLQNQKLGTNNRRGSEGLKISILGEEEMQKRLTKNSLSAFTIKIRRGMRSYEELGKAPHQNVMSKRCT